jgi:hypothetical protein
VTPDARSVLERIAVGRNAGYLQDIAKAYLAANPHRNGAERISAERVRQVAEKGWAPEHDRTEHADGSLTDAAAALGAPEVEHVVDRAPLWVAGLLRHASEKYTGQDRYRLLEIAGALIAAELDRLGGAS